MSLDPPTALLPLLQCLHALSFGATHLGAVQFAAQAAQPHQAATAQSDFGTVLALGAVAATASSGLLYAAFGGGSYFIMAAMAGAGGVLLLLVRRGA
jgi:PPP family 3-phenylpropionic acid transporter